MESLDQYKTRILIDEKMNIGRTKQEVARSEKLKIGQTVPQVQDLLGEPHEKIFRGEGGDTKEQLWVYFMLDKTLQLTFDDFSMIMEKLLEDISFTASDIGPTSIKIDTSYVEKNLGELIKSQDLSKFIL